MRENNNSSEPCLPGMDGFEKPHAQSRICRLFYATNSANMMGILSSGQIRNKAGWPQYARDFQEMTPGYIPLFADGIPHDSLRGAVTRHDENDFPVVVEFDPGTWGASVPSILKAGVPGNACLPELAPELAVLLFKGMIPLADAKKLHFEDEKALKRFQCDCMSFANTRYDLIPADSQLGDIPNISLVIPPEGIPSPGLSDIEIQKLARRADCIGGILAAISRKRIAVGGQILKDLLPEWSGCPSTGDSPPSSLPVPVYSVLKQWVSGQKHPVSDSQQTIMAGILDFLGDPKRISGISADELLSELARKSEEIPESQRALFNSRMRTLGDAVLAGRTPEKLFQQNVSALFRGLLLFLLEPEYHEDACVPLGRRPDTSDELVAEIFRGAYRGWSRVPVKMRGPIQSELAIGYAQARLANQHCPGSLQLKQRQFEWETVEQILADILREIARILTESPRCDHLKLLIAGQKAAGMEISIASGPQQRKKTAGKKQKPPGMEIKITDGSAIKTGIIYRTLEGKTKKKICYRLELPV